MLALPSTHPVRQQCNYFGMGDLQQQTKIIARRLIKNRLKYCISLARVEDDDKWSSVALINDAAFRQARADWDRIIPAWGLGSREELITLVLKALREAVYQVQEDLHDHLPMSWLDWAIESFLDTFKLENLL